MFKKILVPVDGSPTSQQAVSRAVALAKAFDGEVFAICVIDPYPFTGVGTDFAYGQSQYLEAAAFEANNAIRNAREAIAASGVTGQAVASELGHDDFHLHPTSQELQ